MGAHPRLSTISADEEASLGVFRSVVALREHLYHEAGIEEIQRGRKGLLAGPTVFLVFVPEVAFWTIGVPRLVPIQALCEVVLLDTVDAVSHLLDIVGLRKAYQDFVSPGQYSIVAGHP